MKCFFYAFAFPLVLLMIIAGCQHKTDTPTPLVNNGNGSSNNGNGVSNTDTGICFQRDILPIFISNCAKSGCHDAATQQDGYRFDSYQAIVSKKFYPGSAGATELYEKITEDRHDKIMPPPPNAPLTAQQVALIRDWINKGALNSANCSSGCDTTQFAYTAAIKPLFDNNCKGCHNNTLSSGGHSFETHSSTVAVVNSGRILGAIKHQTDYKAMPQGSNKLSDCQITKIEKWIAAGSPNN